MTEGALPPQQRRELRRESFRVRMADVDAARLIYFGAPLIWAESLFSGWLLDCGEPLSALVVKGAALPAVHSEVDYYAPLGLDDPVVGVLTALKVSTRSFVLASSFYAASNSSGAAVVVRVTHVYVELLSDDGGMRACALPPTIAASLQKAKASS